MTAAALGATIRIEAETRWDALALAARLGRFHTYLVQLADSRWLVCVRADGDAAEVLDEVRRTADAWASERGARPVVTVADAAHPIRG